MIFENREDAGRQLADRVAELDLEDPVVLGLPRGGVPVAYQVARRIGAPLDVVVVRKVGAPHNPEYGVGAVGEEGVVLLNDEALAALGSSREDMQEAVAREQRELERRVERYRSGRPAAGVSDRSVVVVDDGLATGVSATAAARVLRERDVRRLVLAVPVGAPESLERVSAEYDQMVYLHAPSTFMAVGSWYRDFGQTTDETVIDLLSDAYDGAAKER